MTCLVDHAYPEPTVSILYDRGGGDRIRLEGVEVRSGQYPDGAWRKVVFAVLSEATLIEDTSFHCDVRLPDTHFLDGKTIFYFPGMRTERDWCDFSKLDAMKLVNWTRNSQSKLAREEQKREKSQILFVTSMFVMTETSQVTLLYAGQLVS